MNVPKLRFKEFNGEYKNIAFDKLANYKKGPFGSSLKKDMFVPKDTNSIKVYEQQNAIKKDWTLERYFITKEYYEKLKGFTVKPGDIIVSCAGTIGEYYVLPFNAEIGIINQALMRISTNNLINQNYFLYIFDNMVSHFSKTFSNGSAIKNIPPFSDLKKQIAYIPSIEEQNKVAQFLSLLDKKIELQTKKIEALKLFKSSQICTTLNKLEHKNVFLKNLGYFISGNPIGKDKITDKGTPVILYGDLYTKYEEEINDVNQYVKENKKYIKSEKGDLIFPTSTTVDAISLISPSVINISDVVYGGDLIVFKVKKAIVNPKFLSYQINHLKRKEFSKKAQGSTIIHIHADDLLNSTVEIPIMKYQNIISNFGSEINKKIELEKNKLDKLKLLKIGLLQNMFI